MMWPHIIQCQRATAIFAHRMPGSGTPSGPKAVTRPYPFFFKTRCAPWTIHCRDPSGFRDPHRPTRHAPPCFRQSGDKPRSSGYSRGHSRRVYSSCPVRLSERKAVGLPCEPPGCCSRSIPSTWSLGLATWSFFFTQPPSQNRYAR